MALSRISLAVCARGSTADARRVPAALGCARHPAAGCGPWTTSANSQRRARLFTSHIPHREPPARLFLAPAAPRQASKGTFCSLGGSGSARVSALETAFQRFGRFNATTACADVA